MSESKDVGEKELLGQFSTAALISELKSRKLSENEIVNIQQLKPTLKDEESQTESVTPEKPQADIEEDETLVDRFVGAAKRSNVHAKLPQGTRIGDKVIEPLNVMPGFKDYGGVISSHGDFGIGRLQGLVDFDREKLPDIFNAQLVAMYPTPFGLGKYSKNELVLGIYFQQDTHEIETRQKYTMAKAEAVFTREIGLEFYRELKKNPDILEKFYQKLFPNLDSNNGGPGLKE